LSQFFITKSDFTALKKSNYIFHPLNHIYCHITGSISAPKNLIFFFALWHSFFLTNFLSHFHLEIFLNLNFYDTSNNFDIIYVIFTLVKCFCHIQFGVAVVLNSRGGKLEILQENCRKFEEKSKKIMKIRKISGENLENLWWKFRKFFIIFP
jgi:hypothetical protein